MLEGSERLYIQILNMANIPSKFLVQTLMAYGERTSSAVNNNYPPWWKTNLAYAIYILIIITFVTSIWRILQIRLKLKHQVEIEHIHAENIMR